MTPTCCACGRLGSAQLKVTPRIFASPARASVPLIAAMLSLSRESEVQLVAPVPLPMVQVVPEPYTVKLPLESNLPTTPPMPVPSQFDSVLPAAALPAFSNRISPVNMRIADE